MRRPIILCFVAVYLPGYRSGGPVRTISNLVDHLGDEFDIRIVTKDRDALDTAPYPDAMVDGWNDVGKARVFYASARTLTLRGVAGLLKTTPHDILYLNSFFAFGFTALPLVARWLRLAPVKPCLIAPRGEFSSGAIRLKAWKKHPYCWFAKRLGLYRGLCWQASSELEKQDIIREFGVGEQRILVAPDLAPCVNSTLDAAAGREPGPLRILFLSRISPMKNLDYLLRVLCRVRSRVEFTIYGPLREPDYWEMCQGIMAQLPLNITARYAGEVTPIRVLETFAAHDLFVLPTRGENYGHVILESLTAGTPVLISDQTPWRASDDGAVEVLPLADLDEWVAAIERWTSMDDARFTRCRQAASGYARHYLSDTAVVEQNRALFRHALRADLGSTD